MNIPVSWIIEQPVGGRVMSWQKIQYCSICHATFNILCCKYRKGPVDLPEIHCAHNLFLNNTSVALKLDPCCHPSYVLYCRVAALGKHTQTLPDSNRYWVLLWVLPMARVWN